MKKLLFFLFGLLVVIFVIPVQRGAAETPDPTPVPDALVAEALAAKRASYPAWVGDEVGYVREGIGGFENEKNIILDAPSTLDDWTGVVLQMYVNGSWEIFKFQGFDETFPLAKTQLTNVAGADVLPRYNSDATSIVFASSRDGNAEIYTMDPEGGSLKRLTIDAGADSEPQWFADDSKIVFVSARDGNAEIYVMNADGTGQTRLTTNDLDDVYPTVSPNGTQIAWLRAFEYGASVWVMNADGSNPLQITPWLAYAQHLNWSPDGQWLTWDGDITEDGWNEVIMVKPDGSALQQVFGPGSYLLDRWVSSWAPDSQSIFLSSVFYTVNNYQLYISWTLPLRFSLATGIATQFDSSVEFALNHHAQFMDLLPPVSMVYPLPSYSQVLGFPLLITQNDYGPSGIQTLAVQYRVGQSGSWLDWVPETSGGTLALGVPGEMVYFRTQAIDKAGNIEDWPNETGDAMTTLISGGVTGQVMDGRDIPLPDSTLMFSPAVLEFSGLNVLGKFTTWLLTTGIQNLSVSNPFYGSFPDVSIEPIGIKQVDYYLPAQDNMIQNGSFEIPGEGLASWTITGTLSTSTSEGHTGNTAFMAGETCWSCVTEGEFIDTNWQVSRPLMRRGANGTVHLLSGQLTYYQWSPENGWSVPYQIPGHAWSSDGDFLDMEIDTLGGVHVAWLDDTNAYYVDRDPNGQWTSPVLMSDTDDAKLPQIELDSLNTVHYVYLSYQSEVWYSQKSITGNWTPKKVIATDYMRRMLVDQSGWIHLFGNGSDCGNGCTNLRHLTITPNGSQTLEEIAQFRLYFDVAMDAKNQIHLAFVQPGSEYMGYKYRDANGNWSQKESVSVTMQSINLDVDLDGGIHVAGLKLSDGFWYIYKGNGNTWSQPVVLGNDYWGDDDVSLIVDTNGRSHFVWPSNFGIGTVNAKHATQTLSTTEADGKLSQSVTIPSDMHKPTLSYMYQMVSIEGFQSGYTLSVTSGPTTTQILSSTTPAETWTLGWADMSQWAGQTVTVTFTLRQAADEPYVRFLLDDVSLGSWLTPVPLAIDLPHIPPFNAPTQITITGENFLEGATVRLDDTPLQNIQWIDEHTLQATIPANLPPGRYHLWVTNPGGQASVLANAVIAGHEIFLPILAR